MKKMIFKVSFVLGESVELRFLDRVCWVPSANVMMSSNGGFSADGNNITVALLMMVLSEERSKSNLTTLVVFSASAV